jgi:hypothetical protein
LQAGGVFDNAGQPAARQWLAAGEPNLGDAEPLDSDPYQAGDLVVGQQQRAGQPVQPFSLHAVTAAQVAPGR